MKQVAFKINFLLLVGAAFVAAFFGTLPAEAAVSGSASTATSPSKVYCVSGGQNFAVGTERTSITNASGTTSVIADGRFVCRAKDGRGVWEREGSLPRPATSTPTSSCVSGGKTYAEGTKLNEITVDGKTTRISDASFICRIKDGRGVWEREGSLPGKPTNPICIKGKSYGISTGSIGSRPVTQECLGGNGSTTSVGGGIGTPKPGTSPILCRWFNKTYQEGAARPMTSYSTSFHSRNTKITCQNGVWRPAKQASSSVASTTRSGQVRGVSISVPERERGLKKIHGQLKSLMEKLTTTPKIEDRFVVGDTVVTTDTVKVRALGAGGVLGTQPAGATGVITETWVNAANRGWYKVDFATGVDGFVAASYLKSSVPVKVAAINFAPHQSNLATSTIVATDGMAESFSPISYTVSVSSPDAGTSVAIENLAVSFVVTGAAFSDVVESVSLSFNGGDYADVIFDSTNGPVTTLVFAINEPVIIESDNEAVAEVRLVLKDSVASLANDVTIKAQVSTTDAALTSVADKNATVTYSGAVFGNLHTIVVAE